MAGSFFALKKPRDGRAYTGGKGSAIHDVLRRFPKTGMLRRVSRIFYDRAVSL